MIDIDDARFKSLFEERQKGGGKNKEAFTREIYPFLHQFVHRRFGKQLENGTLQTTMVLNDFLMKLEKNNQLHFEHLGALMSFASKVIRQYLADYYKKKMAAKRGGDILFTELEDDQLSPVHPRPGFLLEFNLLMTKLEKNRPVVRKVLDLKITAGLSILKIAELLGTTEYEVKRDFEYGRNWLKEQLRYSPTP